MGAARLVTDAAKASCGTGGGPRALRLTLEGGEVSTAQLAKQARPRERRKGRCVPALSNLPNDRLL